MRSPDWLRDDTYMRWNGGPGHQVWATLDAAWRGDLPTLQTLLAVNPALVHCQEGYRQPLYLAVLGGHREVVTWLLEQGGSAMDGPDGGPRQRATDRHQLQLRGLLDRHLFERYGMRPEVEPVADAIRRRDVAAVEALLDADPTLLSAGDYRGNQPLHWAALTRNLVLIDRLLERGAAINARRPDGARATELAYGDYEYRTWYRERGRALGAWHAVVGYLLARGADYDLVIAAHVGDVERAELLLDADPSLAKQIPPYAGYYSGYPLRVAAAAGHLDVVKLLLDRGADPNMPEPFIAPWGGALADAAAHGHLTVAETLLAAGANPQQEIESGGNSLSLAAHWKHASMVELLTRHGARWPIWYLLEHGTVREVEALLEQEPAEAFDVRNFANAAAKGRGPLRELFLRYQPDAWIRTEPIIGDTPEITTALFSAGLDARLASWLGVTAAHQLAARGDCEQLLLFLEHGASLEATDDEYAATPLGWAARHGQFPAAELLLDRGANPNGCAAGANEWARPLAWALSRGHQRVADLLVKRGALSA